ncbi:MAG: DNA repair protein RadA, partial [Endomicrobia bacterium]|nr:DNA repair protein RadA [Endomicrobiia bacterium]
IVAIYSSHKNVKVDTKTIYIGEVGLTGELRPVCFVNERINEISKLGYKKLVLPYENKKNVDIERNRNLNLVYIRSISEIDKIL